MMKNVDDKNRHLGKITAILLTASMIVGTGLFTSLGAATAKAGSGILLALLIGGVVALLTGLSGAQVGVNYPEEGGAFIWTRRFGFPTISFLSGCAYLFDGITGIGILALGFAKYSHEMLSWVSIPAAASIAIIAVAIINFLGIKPTAKVLISIFFINVILLFVYVIFSLAKIHIFNLFPLLGGGIGGVLSGAATFFWTWDGFQRTAIMADQIKEPKRTIPFAVIGGISIAAIIYLIIAATTLGVLGAKTMGSNDTPVFLNASLAIGITGGWIILLSAWMTSFSEMLGDLLPTSKVAHAMGVENELPHWLGAMHKRFHSPYNSLIVLTIIGIALVVFVPIRNIMPLASAFTIMWYIATHFSALKLPKEKRFLPYSFTWVGIATCIGLFIYLPLWSITVAIGILGIFALIRSFVLKKHSIFI